MASILIVDDSEVDRTLASRLLEREYDFSITFAENGSQALEQISTERPDLIISDLQMPQMDGLELVTAVRRDHPSVPVVLMTARGSEEIAAQAIRIGAAGYVPKGSLATNLGEMVARVLDSSECDRLHSHLFHCLNRIDCQFRLHNDPVLIPILTERIQEYLRCLPLDDESERMRVSSAVCQALWIAHYHGNLEIPLDSDLSDKDFQTEVQRRGSTPPAPDRSIDIHVAVDPDQAVFDIRYEGPGIDVERLPPDLESRIAQRSWLSGFVMIPAIVDDVSYVQDEKRISLIKCAATAEDDDIELS